MIKKVFIITILLSLSVIFIAGTSAFSGSQEIKVRIKARLPIINVLKDEGIVGENNRGFLEFRVNNRSKADVVNAENNDRRYVYSAIAKHQGVLADMVGKRRAKQIAQRAKAGQWIQDENGKWYRKK